MMTAPMIRVRAVHMILLLAVMKSFTFHESGSCGGYGITYNCALGIRTFVKNRATN